MTRAFILLAGATGLLAACQTTAVAPTGPDAGLIAEVPEQILEVAAPGQDLTALRIDPIDGCYTYRHIGPVETTFLPLRSKSGRPICTRAS